MAGRKTVGLPPGVTKLPPGVEINGKLIRISFMYRGQRCREPLAHAKLNTASIAYANNKRLSILTEIREGRFDYLAHFPGSTKGLQFAGAYNPVSRRTVNEGVERWLGVQRAMKASSTVVNYISKARHVSRKFGKAQIADVTKTDLEMFQAELLGSGLIPKTVNDIFTVVRGVWGDAFGDEIIKTNPLDRISNIKTDSEIENADPLES